MHWPAQLVGDDISAVLIGGTPAASLSAVCCLYSAVSAADSLSSRGGVRNPRSLFGDFSMTVFSTSTRERPILTVLTVKSMSSAQRSPEDLTAPQAVDRHKPGRVQTLSSRCG